MRRARRRSSGWSSSTCRALELGALGGSRGLSPPRRDWPIVVRRARADDAEAVLGFASRTWDGWDYIPHAWPVWLEAGDGVLLVACRPDDDRPIAVARVAIVAPGEAWLEGIRVDPEVRGMDVATDLQIAELHWAVNQGASVVRYATGARNEASHRLGARHGFALLTRLRNFWWSATGSAADEGGHDGPSAFAADVRAAATARRRELLRRFDEAGLVAEAAETDALWQGLVADASFRAGGRLYEPRPWAFQELTAEAFAGHAARGEVLVARGEVSGARGEDGWAGAVFVGEQQPSEEAEMRLAVVGGVPEAALGLLNRLREVAGEPLRLRLGADAPLREVLEQRGPGHGWVSPDWELHLLARPLDEEHPPPPIDPDTLLMGWLPSDP